MDGLLILTYAIVALIIIYFGDGQLKIVIPAVILAVIIAAVEIVKMTATDPPPYVPKHVHMH